MTEKTSQELFYPVLISVEEERCCYDCRFWRGRCTQGKRNCISWTPACFMFKPKTGMDIQIPLLVEVTA